MEYGKEKKYHAAKEKWKRQATEDIEQPNQETIRTLGEKENCKYLGVLEADIIKTNRDQ